MKATGFIRKIDVFGRIPLPCELRREMGINEKDFMEILTHGEYIILKKYEPICLFCGETANIKNFCGKMVCGKCATVMFKRAKAI